MATADLRRRLIELLGGCCCDCGLQACLQFDVLPHAAAPHHHLNSLARIQFYLTLVPQAGVRLRCADCHGRVSAERARIKAAQCFLYSDRPIHIP